MVAFICYFMPAVLAVWLYEVLAKRDLYLKKFLCRYCGYTVIINFVVFAVKKFLLGTGEGLMLLNGIDMTPSSAFNYILIALISAVVLVLVEVLFSKRIRFAVEETNEENA